MPDSAIDLVHLSRQTAGDRELERELLALFAGQCRRHLAVIGDEGRETGHRRDAAHSLKGAARAIGAWAVGDAADAVERAFAEAAPGARRAAAVSALAGAAGLACRSIERLAVAA